MKQSGERLTAAEFRETTFEHLHRYAVAGELVRNKSVLDIACGEGYGTNLLAQSAASVTGIDIDADTIAQARAKYKGENIRFQAGALENIPAAHQEFDVVVCFETLEHTAQHEKSMQEMKRVLKPNGILIISTPDKKFYSDDRNYKNPHHLKELYRPEFENLVKKYFRFSVFYTQNFFFGSLVLPLAAPGSMVIYGGDFNNVQSVHDINGRFLLAIASDSEIAAHSGSLFLGTTLLKETVNQLENSVRSSLTYRVGHAVLFPFKVLYNLFQKR